MLIDGPWDAQFPALWDTLDKPSRRSVPQFPFPAKHPSPAMSSYPEAQSQSSPRHARKSSRGFRGVRAAV